MPGSVLITVHRSTACLITRLVMALRMGGNVEVQIGFCLESQSCKVEWNFMCYNATKLSKILKFCVKKFIMEEVQIFLYCHSGSCLKMFQSFFKSLKSSINALSVHVSKGPSVNIYYILIVYKVLLCCTVRVPALGKLKTEAEGRRSFHKDSWLQLRAVIARH